MNDMIIGVDLAKSIFQFQTLVFPQNRRIPEIRRKRERTQDPLRKRTFRQAHPAGPGVIDTEGQRLTLTSRASPPCHGRER